jgi:putative FmdB family regulatory protein
MPLYEYSCSECGPFEAFRPASESAAVFACPSCGSATRRLFTPPGLALLSAPMRRARDREEKSAFEPEVVTTKTGRPMPHLGHSH